MAMPALINVDAEWVDLYNAVDPPIPVGTRLLIHVFSARSRVALSDTADEPTDESGRISLKDGGFYENNSGDEGCWAYCSSPAKIQVQEA